MNAHSADAFIPLYHEDATNLQIALGTPLVGREAIISDFDEFFTLVPDSFTHVENLFQDGEWAILEWTGGGSYQPTGNTFILKGCGFFHIVDGKIRQQRGYWDKHTWYSQVGLLIE